MPPEIHITPLPKFTSVKLTGQADLDEMIVTIAELGSGSRARGDKRVLVDLLELQNEFKFTDHFQIGEEAARQFQHLERLASVVPADQITRTSEKVAVKRGLQLRVFTSMAEAIQWLSEEEAGCLLNGR